METATTFAASRLCRTPHSSSFDNRLFRISREEYPSPWILLRARTEAMSYHQQCSVTWVSEIELRHRDDLCGFLSREVVEALLPESEGEPQWMRNRRRLRV